MAFRVPENRRIRKGPMATRPNEGLYGAFLLHPGDGSSLWVIATDGLDDAGLTGAHWEHVSVHGEATGGRLFTPSWSHMAYIKDVFWEPEDVVLQFHPRRSEYVNCHPNTLHLWRPVGLEIPTPPPILVGPL